MTTNRRTGKTTSDLAAAPGDPQELEREIERTREQLGETVEKLVAKTDVKARAQDKVTDLAGRVKAKVGHAEHKAAIRTDGVRGQLAAAATTAQRQLKATAAPVWQATPEPVRQTVAKGASTARQRRVPLAAATGGLIAIYLVIKWWRSR